MSSTSVRLHLGWRAWSVACPETSTRLENSLRGEGKRKRKRKRKRGGGGRGRGRKRRFGKDREKKSLQTTERRGLHF